MKRNELENGLYLINRECQVIHGYTIIYIHYGYQGEIGMENEEVNEIPVSKCKTCGIKTSEGKDICLACFQKQVSE